MMEQDYVDKVIDMIKKFSDKWKEKLGGDRFKNFRLIEQMTGVPISKQLDLFFAKDVSQIFTNGDEAEDSYFDAAMWAILKLAYLMYLHDGGGEK